MPMFTNFKLVSWSLTSLFSHQFQRCREHTKTKSILGENFEILETNGGHIWSAAEHNRDVVPKNSLIKFGKNMT